MTDDSIKSATIKPKRGISAIWLLPLVAIAISGWLLVQHTKEGGLEIAVSFDNGSGISVGKTPVMYQGINVGEVTSLQLDDDLEGVTATLALNQQIEPLIKENTKFWLVKPQISLSGISGLDTLVEGNYISFKPGDGKAATEFDALLEPPPLASNLPGLRLRIQADTLSSLSISSPVLYQQIDVGEIEGYQLNDQGVELIARIDPPYRHLVNKSSRFWQKSGLKVSAGLQGVDIDAGSIASILAGGITFDTPDKNAAQVEDDAEFRLHESKQKAEGSEVVTLYFQNPEGLDVGSKVRLRGMDVGSVESWHFIDNQPDKGAELRVEIKSPYHRYLNEDTQFWVVKPEVSTSGIRGIDALIGGPYIAVNTIGEGGNIQERYAGLNKPPEPRIQAPGMRLKLRSEELGSVAVGSKVYYRKIAVGQVETVDLDKHGVTIGVFIHERYAKLVHRESLFWNASGINISGSLGGFNIQTESIATVVAGGIAFHTPEVKNPQLAWEGLAFTLHPTYESTQTDNDLNIRLRFNSGSNISKGTEIKYQGIKVGEVQSVEIADDLRGVVVSAQLTPSAKGLARQGSEFWLVKPELGLVGTRNLETLVTGSYISTRPGDGPPQKTFVALEKAPSLRKPEKGLNLVLTTPQRGSIKEGVKVFYRDIPVGEVFAYELAPEATHTLIHVNIEPRFTQLVKSGSKFWNSSGISVKFGLFSGATIRSKSVESLLEGGIAFATPEDSHADAVNEGTQFALHQSVEPDWLDWTPHIPLAN